MEKITQKVKEVALGGPQEEAQTSATPTAPVAPAKKEKAKKVDKKGAASDATPLEVFDL